MKRLIDYTVGNAILYMLITYLAWTWILGCKIELWKVVTVAILHSVLTVCNYLVCETIQKIREPRKEATK
jgi:hypothetical protein